MAMIGLHPAQKYGHTAIGMAPTSVDACSRNVAEATGQMGQDACRTTTIHWAFRDGKYTVVSANPRVSMPIDQLRTWMRIWQEADRAKRIRLTKNWHEACGEVAKGSRWHRARGPLTATISTLIDIKWKPKAHHKWISADGIMVADFMARHIETCLWKETAKARFGSGLETCIPHFGPAAKAYRDFIKEWKVREAVALDYIINNRRWDDERLHEAMPDETIENCMLECSSFKGPDGSAWHKFYKCPCNDHLEIDCIIATDKYRAVAKDDKQFARKWMRAIMPAALVSYQLAWQNKNRCEPIIHCIFSEIY